MLNREKRVLLEPFTRRQGRPEHAPIASKAGKEAERGAIRIAQLDAAVQVTTSLFGQSQRTVYHRET